MLVASLVGLLEKIQGREARQHAVLGARNEAGFVLKLGGRLEEPVLTPRPLLPVDQLGQQVGEAPVPQRFNQQRRCRLYRSVVTERFQEPLQTKNPLGD
jgi:hypothetical protein